MKLTLDTIILFVQSIDKMRHFYTQVMGLDIVEDDQSDWVLLKAGGVHIGLHKIGETYMDELSKGYQFDNNTKIVFAIEQNIDEVRKALLDKHVSMSEIIEFPNYDFLLCDGRDPEGNVFQLKQKK